jgi:hypothetical protein
MAANYNTNVKNSRLTVVRDAIDAGAGPGVLEIGTAGFAQVLAQVTLGDPCATIDSGVLTFSGFPRSDTSANASGTAAAARIRDSSGTDVITGLTVGTSGADINLDTTTIAAGQQVQINSAVITHGPG